MFINAAFSQPAVFTWVRAFLDDGYSAIKKAVVRELDVREGVLDLGCGTGQFCALFPRESYWGVDASSQYIAYARKKHPGYRFMVEDAAHLRMQKKVHQALIVGVLHHLPDEKVKKILESAFRALLTGGRLLIFEDIHLERFNPIGKLVKKFDVGKHIRTHQSYGGLYRQYFDVVKEYTLSCGIADYSVYALEKPFSFAKEKPLGKRKALRKEHERQSL